MLSSDRRWTTTRKSGMTVLGKVPKPINLPSQKLENHGLDPNVEIVPKGTLTWGNRPLLAASSAWGSSTMSSPQADGSAGSPRHASGRPSSGGSGTRPSTGSSERSSEPAAVSWGPGSRPSSASGILPSGHVSVVANRPQSAETRPNSSHLSRFAESSAESASWGASGATEKAAEAPKKSDFTLSSGDFPTLGSEKIDEPKSVQGQSLKVDPASDPSSNLKGASESSLISDSGNPTMVMHGNFNRWNADTYPHARESVLIRSENWHGSNHVTQPISEVNMAARQYGSWPGPEQHPNVVWYGGHESGGLYRPPFGPPGSYYVDPYCPYIPARPNSQVFPRAEAIPGGVHINKGDAYRIIPPDAYIAHGQSAIPIRPGAYHCPVVYEGCYGPSPMSFGNSSEQDASLPVKHSTHNQHLCENPRLQPWRFQAHSDGSAPVVPQQQIISGQVNEPQVPYKVLLKPHGSQEEERSVTVWSDTQDGNQLSFPSPGPGLPGNSYKQEQTTNKLHGEVSHSACPNEFADQNNRNSPVTRKPDASAAHFSDQPNAKIKKSFNLMDKVEVLNSKARVVDLPTEGENFLRKEKANNQNSCSDAIYFEKVGLTKSSSINNTSISDTRSVSTKQLNASTKISTLEPFVELKPTFNQPDEPIIVSSKSGYLEDSGPSHSFNQKSGRNMKGRVEHHHGKPKFCSHDADETNNTPGRNSLEKSSPAMGKSGNLLSGSLAYQEAPENQSSYLNVKSVYDPSSLKSADHDNQHAKLKEQARLRAIELQKEEEERIAEQKAKALAKLGELDRRTAASKQNLRPAQPSCDDNLGKHETVITSDNPKTAVIVSETFHGNPCDFQAKAHSADGIIVNIGDSTNSSVAQPSRTIDSSLQATARATSDLQEGIVSRRKQASYRKKRYAIDERNLPEKLTNYEDALENLDSADTVVQPSNKSNRGSKYKSKLDNSQLSSIPSSMQPEVVSGKLDLDSNETNNRTENSLNKTIRTQESGDLIIAPNQAGSEQVKSIAERTSNNWRPQPHRKTTRNSQSDKANAKLQGSENVIWAPVKVINKDGSSEEAKKNSTGEATRLLDGSDTNNCVKARRAEMERYVPKPVAKELSLQGDLHPLSLPAASSSGEHELASEETKQGRHGKTRPSWRQRSSGESQSHEHKVLEGNPSLKPSKLSELELSRPSNNLHVEDTNDSSHLVVMKQKRQQSKEHRADESTNAPPTEALDKREMKSHWQPKSQPQSQSVWNNLDEGNYARQRNLADADDTKYQEGYRERKLTRNDAKYQDGNRESTATKQNPPKNHFDYGSGQKGRPIRDTKNAEQHFEHQNAGYNAGEEATETRRLPSSGLRYGAQARSHARRGSHFYGPRRGSSVRASGSTYDF